MADLPTLTPQPHRGLALQTLDALSLSDQSGPVRVSDPLGLPLLCRILFGDPNGVAAADLLLTMVPDLPSTRAADRISQAMAALERACGAPLVVKTADIYSVAKGLIESELVVDGPGAPLALDQQSRFLSGVLVADAPEFTEWVESVRPRLRTTVQPLENGKPGSLAKTTIGSRTAVAIMAGGFLVLGAVYGTRAKPPAGFSAGDPVVLADFDNQTGDTLFDRSLLAAAIVGLQQSPQLRLVERRRVLAALARMGAADTTSVTPAVARDVSLRTNTRFYVVLKLSRDGDGYALQGEVHDAMAAAAIVTATAAAETRAGTLVALDRVLQEIRAGFGERRSERVARSVPLPEATTPSIEALQSFAAGTGAWAKGEFRIAQELWERALDLDTGFTMAMAALGSYYYYHHDRDRGQQFYQEASKRLGRVTEWERLRILDNYAGYRGDVDSSVVLSRMVAERFPSTVSWYNYGTGLMQAARPAEAIIALKRALTFDSTHVNSYLNLATSSTGLGRTQDAIGYYRAAARFDSTALLRPPISTEFGDKLIVTGQYQAAEEHFLRVLARPALYDRVLAYRGLASLSLWRGNLDQSLGYLRDASTAGRQDSSKLSIARNALLEALALVLAGDSSMARLTLSRTNPLQDSTRFEPKFWARLGHGFLAVGDVDRADVLLARIAASGDTVTQGDKAAYRFLTGAVAVARGEAKAGLAELAGAAGFDRILSALWRSRAHAAQGEFAPAIAWLDSIAARPSTIAEAGFATVASFLAKGELAAAAGDKKAAIASYRRLLDQWKLGDSTSAPARLARARLAALSQD